MTSPTPLVDVPTYRRLTGDTSTPDPDVVLAVADAEELIAEQLKRPGRMRHGTYTDRLRLYDVRGLLTVYPIATPVTDAPGLTVLSTAAVTGALPDDGPLLNGLLLSAVDPYSTVTYSGGWTADTLPLTVRKAIADTARGVLAPVTSVPAGATAVRVGDVAVTYGSTAAVGASLSPATERALRRYVRRRGA